MKKLLSLIITLCLILSIMSMGMFTITASAATSGTTGDCTWKVEDNVLTISGNGKMDNYQINSRLPWSKYITKVIIKDGVTNIGDYAFYCYDYLVDITIPDSVTSIGNYVFYGCDYLLDITIPDSVTSIGNYAFSGCNFTGITIPDGVRSIGDYAFYGCDYLVNMTIPGSVISIGKHAFYDTSLVSVTIGNGVTSIGDYAFYGCNLRSITIPDSVTSIGKYAFFNCTSLTSLTMGNGVKRIGDYAFAYCESLTSVTMGNGVKSIGDYAFEYCESLESLTMGNSVTSIGKYAFFNCNLRSITIPYSVTSIGDSAFSLNSEELVFYVYKTCPSLGYDRDIVFLDGTDKESIISGNFGELSWRLDKRNGELIICGNGKMADFNRFSDSVPWEGHEKYITKVIISSGITSIGDYAFSGCNLTSITIPDSVTSIGDYAFTYCNSLTSITIPDGVTNIGYDVFQNCDDLTSITIPVGVTNIRDYAFSGCSSLKDVWYTGNQATKKTINIGYANTYLTNATWHYNICENQQHSYSAICDESCNICGWKRKTNNKHISHDSKDFTCDECGCFLNINFINQTTSVNVTNGSNATVTINVTGEDLTYKWYYRDVTDIEYKHTASFTSNTYSVVMNSTRADRIVYCIITDKYGNVFVSNPVILKMKTVAKITKQPTSINVAIGSLARVSVTAVGDGITYKWYYKEKGSKSFALTTSFTGNYYSVSMNSARAGRQVYCVVTDKYGNKVTSNTVTLDLKHDFKWITDKANNCGVNGYKHEECTVCHIKRNENTVIPATGNHKYTHNCDKSCNICGKTRTVGAHKYKNNADTSCNYCGAFAYPGGNVLYKENGKYYHIVNRKKVTDTILFKHTDGKYYYVNKGVVDFSKTGLVKHTNGKYYYVQSGKVNTAKTGLVKHTNGIYYYVVKGVKSDATLLVKHTNGKWYYVEGGKVNTAKTGLVKHTDGNYYHVSKGVKTTSTLLFKHTNGKYYYVQTGKVNFAKTGLVKHSNGKYYYVEKGVVNTAKNGRVKHTNGKYYTVKKGVVV